MGFSTVLKPSWKLHVGVIVDGSICHLRNLSILALIWSQLSDHLVELHIFDLFDIEIQIAFCVVLLKQVTELHCCFSLLERSFVVADLLPRLPSDRRPILGL